MIVSFVFSSFVGREEATACGTTHAGLFTQMGLNVGGGREPPTLHSYK
jgi:hypothetical protein